MTETAREELIKRLEKAEGPSRELDGAIFLTLPTSVCHDDGRFGFRDRHGVLNFPGANYDPYMLVPKFTSSIDAALTLFSSVSAALAALQNATYYVTRNLPAKDHSKFQVVRRLIIAALKAMESENG